MAFRKILILIVPLLLFSCAQVGTISGGEKDDYAPKPLSDKTNPPYESTFYTGNSVEITFDEFIQLNNPVQTMVLVPNHAKLKASIHKKTLKISWEEKLQDNTTYVIYLNGTVKDVTENNDSLMYFAFSTGSFIDSLTYTVTVIDAWNNKFISGATVGLYTPNDTIKPYYFAQTNQFGEASFAYLKAGDYKLLAFTDENKDLQIQPSEGLAFREQLIHLDSSVVDTVPLRVSVPKRKKQLRTFNYLGPGSFIVGANYSLEKAEFILNNSRIDSNSISYISKDSVQLFTDVKDVSEAELIVNTENFSDTISLRLTEKEKAVSLRLLPEFKDKMLGLHESLTFKINDRIVSFDPTKIHLRNPADSSLIDYKASIHLNTLTLDFDRAAYKEVSLKLNSGAVKTALQQSDSANYLIQLKTERDYGIVHVDASGFEGQIIVEILQNSAVVDRAILNENKKCVFSNLVPGTYEFRVIKDSNANQEWDPADIHNMTQAEQVFWYSTATKVRANWEIDIQLSPL